MSAKHEYTEGTRLKCLGGTGYRVTGFEGYFARVFLSRLYGLGVRFEDYNYSTSTDCHTLENFVWEECPKTTNLCGFLRKVKDSY